MLQGYVGDFLDTWRIIQDMYQSYLLSFGGVWILREYDIPPTPHSYPSSYISQFFPSKSFGQMIATSQDLVAFWKVNPLISGISRLVKYC